VKNGALGSELIGRVRRIEANRIRLEIAERSDSEVLGLLAGGVTATVRWLVLAGDGVGRELRGLGRAVVAYRNHWRKERLHSS